jgi:hypothetical protein
MVSAKELEKQRKSAVFMDETNLNQPYPHSAVDARVEITA